VAEAPGERWRNIEAALYDGSRGLPGGDTLARLLDRSRRGKPGGPPRRAGWSPAEDELLRALPPREAARWTGRSLAAVHQRRHVLGIGPVRHRRA
jgi:hypothetical protein